jgi:hypothetical protein
MLEQWNNGSKPKLKASYLVSSFAIPLFQHSICPVYDFRIGGERGE